jgi:hypothetical protein
MEEGLRQWKTWRGGWLGGGEACAELRHGRARQTERGVKKIRPTASGSVLRAAWDSGEGGSGSGDAMRHEACGAWLRPAGGVPTVSQPTAARVCGAPLFRQWHADAADVWAPAVGGRGSEKREAWAHMGRPGQTWSGPGLEKQ